MGTALVKFKIGKTIINTLTEDPGLNSIKEEELRVMIINNACENIENDTGINLRNLKNINIYNKAIIINEQFFHD